MKAHDNWYLPLPDDDNIDDVFITVRFFMAEIET